MYNDQNQQDPNGYYNGPDNGGNNYNNGNGGNYYNNNNNNANRNNGNKWTKVLAIIAGVAVVLVMTSIMGVVVNDIIDQFGKKASSDELAWNAGDSDDKDNQTDKSDDDTNGAIATTEPVSVSQSTGVAGGGDVSGIVESVMPSVVSITSTSSVKGYSFFGQPYEQEVASCGTGFIVGKNDKELLLATNSHVVEGATAIQIEFIDGATAEASVKGNDADADLAVVAVKLEDIDDDTMSEIKVAVLGDSDKVKVGQLAIAIGNAKGMGQSVTVGYISAKDRQLDISDETTGQTRKMNYIQTDAAINGGNSGGPLLDVSGNVVGIYSAKITDTQIEGMCYAIPISSAIPIINELMNRETLNEDEKGYMGVSLSDVSSEAIEKYGVPQGAYVSSVLKKSPAEKAGIAEGDIITKINDTEIKSSSAATAKITSSRAGTDITIVLYRLSSNGAGYEQKEVKVTLVTAKELGIDTSSNQDKGAQDNQTPGEEDYYDDDRDDSYNYNPFEDFFNW